MHACNFFLPYEVCGRGKNVNFMDLNSMFASGCMFAIYLIKVAPFCCRSFTLLLALEVRKKGKSILQIKVGAERHSSGVKTHTQEIWQAKGCAEQKKKGTLMIQRES